MPDDDDLGLRVLVVGPCAAGKTTLVNNLRPRGYSIRSCAQEHSHASKLWQRSLPDVLIFLDVELPAISRRQNRSDWTREHLDKQRRRLNHARSHCDFYLRTDDLAPTQVAEAVDVFLRGRGIVPAGG